MATFRRIGDKWRAEVARKGVRKSRVCATKVDAQKWAASIEFTLKQPARHTLHDAFKRYAETVSSHKKGERWELLRIAAFKRQLPDRLLSAVTSDTIAKWRDERLKVVSTGTVRREMNLFGVVFSTAVNEWGWIDSSPFNKVKRPADGKPKERVISDVEAAIFVAACTSPIQKKVAQAFSFALETGMRAGEICGIRHEHIHSNYVYLGETKNGTDRRVPLSHKARATLPPQGFGLSSRQLDVHFRIVRDELGADYTFHSTRHTAATRLAQKLTPFQLCKMFGWKDLKMAMRYSHTDLQSILDRL